MRERTGREVAADDRCEPGRPKRTTRSTGATTDVENTYRFRMRVAEQLGNVRGRPVVPRVEISVVPIGPSVVERPHLGRIGRRAPELAVCDRSFSVLTHEAEYPTRDGLAGRYPTTGAIGAGGTTPPAKPVGWTDPRTAPGVERVCASRAGVTSGHRAHSDRAAADAGRLQRWAVASLTLGVVVAVSSSAAIGRAANAGRVPRRCDVPLGSRRCAGARQRGRCQRVGDPHDRGLARDRPTPSPRRRRTRSTRPTGSATSTISCGTLRRTGSR